MKVSGELQAEIFKAAMVMTVAGLVIYFGKKFVDGLSEKVGNIPDTLGKAASALGGAVGSAGSAAVSGIEKAVANTSQNQKDFAAAQMAKITEPLFPAFDTGPGNEW